MGYLRIIKPNTKLDFHWQSQVSIIIFYDQNHVVHTLVKCLLSLQSDVFREILLHQLMKQQGSRSVHQGLNLKLKKRANRYQGRF